ARVLPHRERGPDVGDQHVRAGRPEGGGLGRRQADRPEGTPDAEAQRAPPGPVAAPQRRHPPAEPGPQPGPAGGGRLGGTAGQRPSPYQTRSPRSAATTPRSPTVASRRWPPPASPPATIRTATPGTGRPRFSSRTTPKTTR